MGHFTVSEAKNRFSDLLRRAEYRGERVVVQRHGKPVAAIVSTEDLRRLETLEDESDASNAAAALREAETQGTVSLETVLKRHGLGHLLAAPAKPKAALVKSPTQRTKRTTGRAGSTARRPVRKSARRAE